MVAIGAFPIAKLGALLLKQISKPIANAIKQQAKSSPVFSKYVCMPPARFYNWCEIKAKMWVLHLGKPINITVLNDEMAIELGANLLGETIIFLIASGVLIFEYNRSSKKEAAKEEAKRREVERLQETLTELFMQTEEQAAHIRELTRKLGDLETRVVQKPWVPKKEIEEQPKEPPIPQRRQRIEIMDVKPSIENVKFVNHVRSDQQEGLLLNAVRQIEDELWSSSNATRQNGIITVALNYVYQDVYRIPMKFDC